MVSKLGKTTSQFLKKLNVKFSYDPAIPPPKYLLKGNENICAHEDLYMNVHNSPSVHQLVNGDTKHGIPIYWNIEQ